MDLIVEDGTGVEGANTYVTLEETTDFLAARGRATWVALDPEVQKTKIIQAADYLNAVYGWGLSYDHDQGMAIPTLLLDFVPANVKRAQILLAYEASLAELTMPIDGGSIKSTRKKLEGVGEKETVYQDDTPPTGRRFPLIDALLSPYVTESANDSLQVARRLVG